MVDICEFSFEIVKIELSMINKLNPFFQCSYTWRCKYLYMSKLLLVVYNNSEENRLKIPLQNIFEIRSSFVTWAICGVIKTLQIVLVGTLDIENVNKCKYQTSYVLAYIINQPNMTVKYSIYYTNPWKIRKVTTKVD